MTDKIVSIKKAAAPPPFSKGEIIRLKGGFVPMVVESVTSDCAYAIWHNRSEDICGHPFAFESVELVEAAEKQ